MTASPERPAFRDHDVVPLDGRVAAGARPVRAQRSGDHGGRPRVQRTAAFWAARLACRAPSSQRVLVEQMAAVYQLYRLLRHFTSDPAHKGRRRRRQGGHAVCERRHEAAVAVAAVNHERNPIPMSQYMVSSSSTAVASEPAGRGAELASRHTSIARTGRRPAAPSRKQEKEDHTD